MVGPDGEMRYIEAAERYRQDKRAVNAAAEPRGATQHRRV